MCTYTYSFNRYLIPIFINLTLNPAPILEYVTLIYESPGHINSGSLHLLL